MLAITVDAYSQETSQAIASAEQVFHRIVADTPESLGTGEKEVLLMTFGSLVIEHFRAILMLTRSQMATGSAFALFRPLVDAISRGQWLYLCALPEQTEKFMKRELDLSSIGFKSMAESVDVAVGEGVWLSSFLGIYKQMCDYTHTGHDAVACRLASDGGIEPTYPEERIRTLVVTSARIVLLHFITACKRVGHEESAAKLTEAFTLLPD